MSYLYQINRPGIVTETTPILVTLHGMGSNDHDLALIAGHGPVDFVQIDIQGNIPFRSGFTYYIPDFSVKSEKEILTETLTKIDRFLIEVLKKEELSPKQPLFFLGFSQGAILSLSYGLLYPDKLKGAVILNGRLPQFVAEVSRENHARKKTSFFVAQGEFDSVFPLAIGRSVKTYLKEEGFETDYHEYPADHEVIAAEIVEIRSWLHVQFKS